jgi:hypothetical protein
VILLNPQTAGCGEPPGPVVGSAHRPAASSVAAAPVRPLFQKDFVMKTSSSTPCFRPALETLEGRDLPSFLGLALLNLNNQITTATNTMASLNSQLTTTQLKLTGDINTTGADPGNVFNARAAISNDYSRAGSLFGQIKSVDSDVNALKGVQQNLAFAAFGGDPFDQLLALQTLFGSSFGGLFSGLFGGVTPTTSLTADQILAQATATVGTGQQFGFPTIATGANV